MASGFENEFLISGFLAFTISQFIIFLIILFSISISTSDSSLILLAIKNIFKTFLSKIALESM